MELRSGQKFLCALAAGLLLAAPLLAQDAPPVHNREGMRYVTGGIGSDEAAAMKAAARDYSLRLLFVEAGSGAYLADVRVIVKDRNHKTLLDAEGTGPFLHVGLPPGTYEIAAEADGVKLTRRATVPARGAASLTLAWPAAKETASPSKPDQADAERRGCCKKPR